MSKITLEGKTYDVLYTFKTNKKEFVIYTDGIIDEDGFTKVYAGIKKEINGKEKLLPVKSDEDLEIVNDSLSKLTKKE